MRQQHCRFTGKVTGAKGLGRPLQQRLTASDAFPGEQVHPGGPGLILGAHGDAGFPVVPLVELPVPIQLSEVPQSKRGGFHSASFHQSGNIESAQKWPYAAIVVMMRSVERTIVVALSLIHISE